MNRVDEYNRRPFAFRFLEERNQVHAADVHILTPEHDGPTVGNVKHVIAVTVAEVCRLGRLPAPEQMSPDLIVTGPNRSKKWSVMCFIIPNEPPHR